MTRVARDPLFVCLVLGLVVFGIDRWLGSPPQQHVEVTAADVARVNAQWQAQMGRPPTEQELSALIDQHIREEIL
ncbi:MAG: peptidyl-prolyl cis-trans isomerase, partial [Acidobacteriota bacterium]|nr:peptidyl-prolyl cis-trans isomerase [Acidobacteriota bacterium]